MSPEEKSLLERTHKLVEENNDILRSLRRAARWGTAFKVFYWVIILSISFGAYYFIQPYLQTMLGLYGQVENNVDTVSNLTSTIKGLLN